MKEEICYKTVSLKSFLF